MVIKVKTSTKIEIREIEAITIKERIKIIIRIGRIGRNFKILVIISRVNHGINYQFRSINKNSQKIPIVIEWLRCPLIFKIWYSNYDIQNMIFKLWSL